MLSDQGCGTCLEYDLATGRIYLTGAGGEAPTEDPTEDPSEEPNWMTTITFMASSLENRLNAMLNDTFHDRIRAGYIPNEQGIDSYIESSCSDDPRVAWRGIYRFSPDFFTLKEPDLEEWDIDDSAFDFPDS